MIFETSFDDGSKYDLKIAELLKKYNLTGTFYIIVDRVDTSGNLSWKEIQGLKDQGFKIGSHTMSHPQDLKQLFDDELQYELQSSRGVLESVLGVKIDSFCYPRGRFDQRVKDRVIEAGYVYARGTGGIGKTEAEDKLNLPGTVHVFPRKEYNGEHWISFAKRIYNKAEREQGYFHLWGHSEEINRLGLWGELEEFLDWLPIDKDGNL